MLTMKSFGLKGRSITFCVLLVLGAVSSISVALIWHNQAARLQDKREYSVDYARSLGQTAEPFVLLNDANGLKRVVSASASNEDVLLAEIVDTKGKVLARFCREEWGISVRALDGMRTIPGPLSRDSFRIEKGPSWFVVVLPIWSSADDIDLELVEGDASEVKEADDKSVGKSDIEAREHAAIAVDRGETTKGQRGVEAHGDEPIGFVIMAQSLQQVHADLQRHVLFSLIIAISVVILGSVVTLVTVRQWLRPVQGLVETTAAIAEGDLTKRASHDGPKEIVTLAEAFNHMADTLKDYTENLETQVSERTAELQEKNETMAGMLEREKKISMELEAAMEQLQAAMQEAQAANVAKSEFLANMSHEIRTPMTAILGFAESLLEPDLTESERAEAVLTIHRNGEHLLQVINDILDITKVEAGKLVVECIDTSPIELLSEVRSLMRVRVESKGLQFRMKCMGAIPETIQSDPTRLRQILINLLGNAIKFTETGSVRLETQMLPRVPRGRGGSNVALMQFSVIDTGIGMSVEEVDRLFKPFTQADTSMTRKFGGTGLGLAISKRLAEALGGIIDVESEVGKGSTFRLTIPCGPLSAVRMIDHPSEAMVTKPEPRSTVRANVKKLDARILLAEDVIDNQRLLSLLLENAGAEVIVADNGQVASELALAACNGVPGAPGFDVILMDMQMPVLDGYKATRLLRRKGYTGPIIALTAHAMPEDRAKCIDAGCDDYATKPIDIGELIELIRQYLVPGSSLPQDSPDTPSTMVDRDVEPVTSACISETFLKGLVDRVSSIEDAMSRQDLDQLKLLAHHLKSAFGIEAFPSIGEVAQSLEASVEAREDLTRLQTQVEKLIELSQQARTSHPAI